jgi:hypothetical protein
MNMIHKTLHPADPGDYLRIDFPKGIKQNYSADMSNAAPENIHNLLAAGKTTLESKKNELNKFLDGLLD